ncbi:NlpC/P60 family protein [Streptomyces sp. NRRL S-87]|uniref:NlpC/P60 family protein n=1 Tax=Streptomyces sp. NRRL S-87 TaxID=1463920 RepID=UPI00068E744D|nr:NlpC/P60 family protein [Streptomyces sp. NRRL S-87]
MPSRSSDSASVSSSAAGGAADAGASTTTVPGSAFSRRSALAALVGAAAAGPLVAARPAAAAPAVAATSPVGAPVGGDAAVPPALRRAPLTVDAGGTWPFAPHPAGTLTTRTVPGPPELTEVLDDAGVLATLTKGAKTVTVRGPRRWFTEQKKPFTDAFHRTLAAEAGWGSSPGGGRWDLVNGPAADYFVDNERGVFRLSADNSSRYALLLDDGIGDLDATARFSFERVPTGAPCSLALVFAARGVNDHYRARLIVTTAGQVQFVLEKEIADKTSVLSPAVTLGTGYKAYEHWYVRVQKAGPVLRARAWRKDAAEPAGWHHSLRDPETDPGRVFDAGMIGVRALASDGSTGLPLKAYVYDVAVPEAYWADPPVVAHDTWVRLLPAPFDGRWTPELEQCVRAWAGDTSPDALAYASALRPFGTPVHDPALGGAQVLGESGYSPQFADGTREVGADFHDYMGLSWDFPASGEHADPDPAPPGAPAGTDWRGNLDCSGYVRMVYGHHMGVPMVLYRNYRDGNLPRTSKAQSASGPGVVVAQGTTAPPALTALRIGDVVFFDAVGPDPKNPETKDGTVDHTGIYLGRDQHGDLRFASSRRTPNGPTMADLGARSVLNGTSGAYELYPDSLRTVRRF